jgi:hypothetical protein
MRQRIMSRSEIQSRGFAQVPSYIVFDRVVIGCEADEGAVFLPATRRPDVMTSSASRNAISGSSR